MATRTLTQLRQGVGRLVSPRSFYGTANTLAAGGNTTTNLRDSDVRNFMVGRFANHWVLLTSGADSGVVVFCTAFTASTGDYTLTPAASASTAYDAATYEVYNFPPDLITDAINKAVRQLYPWVARVVVDETYVTGSPLFNPGFEYWTSSSACPGWTVNTATLARATTALTQRLNGQYSASLTTATGYLGLSGEQVLDLSQLNGYGITMYALIRTSAGSDARLRIVDSDGNTTGDYHTANDNWELLSAGPRTLRSTDPANPNAYDLRILNDTTTAVYIDRVWIEGGPATRYYRVHDAFYRGPQALYVARIIDREHFTHDNWQQVSFRLEGREQLGADASYSVISTDKYLPTGMAMKMIGSGLPTNLSASTDILEVDAVTGELVEHQAAIMLIDMLIGSVPNVNRDDMRETQGRLQMRRDDLLKRAREPGVPVSLPADV